VQPLAIPRTQVQTLADESGREAATLIVPYVDDLNESDARDVVRGACYANALVEVGEEDSWDGAANNALASFGGSGMLRNRVANLAQDMAKARSSGDQAVQVGAFLLCETV
jgi:hypothetical protein